MTHVLALKMSSRAKENLEKRPKKKKAEGPGNLGVRQRLKPDLGKRLPKENL